MVLESRRKTRSTLLIVGVAFLIFAAIVLQTSLIEKATGNEVESKTTIRQNGELGVGDQFTHQFRVSIVFTEGHKIVSESEVVCFVDGERWSTMIPGTDTHRWYYCIVGVGSFQNGLHEVEIRYKYDFLLWDKSHTVDVCEFNLNGYTGTIKTLG